ncbi:MAG TPA: hypothetical protein VIK89_08930 [Cytophagaceae bacterium]
MNVPAVRKLVENYTISILQEAEWNLIEGKEMNISVGGKDEGEQFTHITAAIWILENMRMRNVEFNEALLEYTKQLREPIN